MSMVRIYHLLQGTTLSAGKMQLELTYPNKKSQHHPVLARVYIWIELFNKAILMIEERRSLTLLYPVVHVSGNSIR